MERVRPHLLHPLEDAAHFDSLTFLDGGRAEGEDLDRLTLVREPEGSVWVPAPRQPEESVTPARRPTAHQAPVVRLPADEGVLSVVVPEHVAMVSYDEAADLFPPPRIHDLADGVHHAVVERWGTLPCISSDGLEIAHDTLTLGAVLRVRDEPILA